MNKLVYDVKFVNIEKVRFNVKIKQKFMAEDYDLINYEEMDNLDFPGIEIDQISADNGDLTRLASNIRISFADAKKLCETNLSKDIQLALASNPSEELPLRFLRSISVLVENRDTLRLFSPVSEYVGRTKKAVEWNIIERVHKLALEVEKSSQIFGGKVNTGISKPDFIDLTKSIRACNELGEFLLSNSDPKEGSIVKYEEVIPENIFDILNPNNPESLIGVVARIKEFFAEFEEKWGSIVLNAMKLNPPLWRVASKLNEDFIISIKDLVKSDMNTYWCGNRRFESGDIDLQLKVVTIINANFPEGKKVFKLGQAYKADLEKVLNGLFDVVSDGAFRIAFDLKELNLANDAYTQEIQVNFDALFMYRDVYKHILAELKNTELPTSEQLKLAELERLEEQKLIAEGPLAIAQREFDENLSSIGDPLEYVKAEMLRRMHEKTMEIDEKFRIQPFLQSFWDEINQNTFELEQLKSFRPPKSIINEDGKQVLETQEESKSAFFKLIDNLFIGNGRITRALNPSNNPSIPSPQSQIKDFYKQLCQKFIPESVLDDLGNVVNTKVVDNNIFNNPQLNIPPIYLEFLSTLLDKLRARYEEVLKERIKFEKSTSQDSIYLNITNQLKRERLKITRGLDNSVSNLIIAEIKKVAIVQRALEVRVGKK
jgi:hypothetical protein